MSDSQTTKLEYETPSPKKGTAATAHFILGAATAILCGLLVLLGSLKTIRYDPVVLVLFIVGTVLFGIGMLSYGLMFEFGTGVLNKLGLKTSERSAVWTAIIGGLCPAITVGISAMVGEPGIALLFCIPAMPYVAPIACFKLKK